MRKKRESALLLEPGLGEIQSVVYVLNHDKCPAPTYAAQRFSNEIDFSEMRAELRRLVQQWQESGPNLQKMLAADPQLAGRIKHGRTHLIATQTGKGLLLWLPDPKDFDPISQKDTALTHFMDLIVNPHWEKLGGPCARCGQYYVKKTKRQKAYCSRSCGSAATAVAAARSRRAKEHMEKLRKARHLISEWSSMGKTKIPWKDWISARSDITITWLTRAVNRGELQPPPKLSDSCWRRNLMSI